MPVPERPERTRRAGEDDSMAIDDEAGDERSTAETPPEAPGAREEAVEAPAAEGGARPPSRVPIHSIVFAVLAVVAIAVGIAAADAYHEALEAQAFPGEVRRFLAFALFFNAAAGVAFAVVLLAELLGAIVSAVKGRWPGRCFVRVLVAAIPLLIFGIGHAVLNPWLWDLLERVREMASGGG